MFYRYEIKNVNGEDILYLYLTMNYEFSKELGLNSSDKELKRRTKNFISNNNIDFLGNKVYLVIDGVVVKSINLEDKKVKIETLENNLYYSSDHYLITLELSSGAVIEVSLRDYLLGVVATNMIFDDLEVLKVMCVLYRTYAFKEMAEAKLIKSINRYAVYKPISYYKLSFAPRYDDIINKINKAIDETDCIFLSYKNNYVLPFIHICNNGHTLEDTRYPYLSSVNSIWDLTSPYYIDIKKFDYPTLSKLFNMTISNETNIKILEISPNGRLLKIKIGNNIYDALEFVRILDLKSLYLNIIINRDNITFITRGYGEYVGLSLYGALSLAENGCSYTSIISYYFPKININKYVKELS